MNALLKVFVLVFSVVTLLACGGGESASVIAAEDATTMGRMKILSVASDGVMSVQLPFPDGVARECYQNSHDTPTHSASSTMSDLDFAMPVGSIVVAAADGTVHIHDDATKTGGFGWYVAVDHGNYWTIYAHLSGFIATEGQQVIAGQPIAYSGGKAGHPGAGTSTGAHLHFGVHSRSGVGTSQRMAAYALNRNTGTLGYFVTGNGTVGSDFTCAVFSSDGKTKLASGHFYESRPIGAVFSEFSCEAVSGGGVLCWKGNPVDCVDGNSHVWYHKNNEGAYLSESNSGTWQKCLQTTGSTNLLVYLDGGYGVGGVGPGTETDATDDLPDPPDFVTKRSWLETPWGYETYQYGQAETLKMKGQFKNDGDGPCIPGEKETITVHAYLSKGYKEDAHSDWKLVGTDEIQCSNLRPGDTHTETEGLILADLPLGIHNVVWCIDHPKTDHNDGGDHREKHESNNCSTEAVFEIVPGTVNVPTVDFIVHGLSILQAPTYTGDLARFGGYIKNQGTARPGADIRSSYTIACGGGPSILLTDDETKTDQLTPGESAWEETVTAVRMPDTPGVCTVTMTADYQGAQTETDETNNSTSLTLTLLPRPMPDLVVTYIEIDPWPDRSIQKGKEHHPTMKIKNVGLGPVTSSIRSAYYWYGPSTGNVWRLIADDGTEAQELCAGCEVTETIKSGFKATKTGTHYLKACVDYQGNQPEGDEGNNCLQSAPITVK